MLSSSCWDISLQFISQCYTCVTLKLWKIFKDWNYLLVILISLAHTRSSMNLAEWLNKQIQDIPFVTGVKVPFSLKHPPFFLSPRDGQIPSKPAFILTQLIELWSHVDPAVGQCANRTLLWWMGGRLPSSHHQVHWLDKPVFLQKQIQTVVTQADKMGIFFLS